MSLGLRDEIVVLARAFHWRPSDVLDLELDDIEWFTNIALTILKTSVTF